MPDESRPRLITAVGLGGPCVAAGRPSRRQPGEQSGAINRDLAIAAREVGVPIATGSMSAYFADESVADTFSVMRREYPDGFIMANISATASVEKAKRAIGLLRADALQIHLNSIQETVMPEGDRSFSSWLLQIEKIMTGVDVPVIVKEV